jgi:hypothetical protein
MGGKRITKGNRGDDAATAETAMQLARRLHGMLSLLHDPLLRERALRVARQGDEQRPDSDDDFERPPPRRLPTAPALPRAAAGGAGLSADMAALREVTLIAAASPPARASPALDCATPSSAREQPASPAAASPPARARPALDCAPPSSARVHPASPARDAAAARPRKKRRIVDDERDGDSDEDGIRNARLDGRDAHGAGHDSSDETVAAHARGAAAEPARDGTELIDLCASPSPPAAVALRVGRARARRAAADADADTEPDTSADDELEPPAARAGLGRAPAARVARCEWPPFARKSLEWDHAVRLWAELLLKCELDGDFEELVLSTPRHAGSALYLSAASRVESLFAATRDSVVDSCAWTAPFRAALHTRPELSCALPCASGADCEACGRRNHPAESRLRLGGAPTDGLASWIGCGGRASPCARGGAAAGSDDDGDGSDDDWGGAAAADFLCGRVCRARASAYHDLLWFKLWAQAQLARAARPLSAAGVRASDIVERLIPQTEQPRQQRRGAAERREVRFADGGGARGRSGQRDLGREIGERARLVLERAAEWNRERARGEDATTPSSHGRTPRLRDSGGHARGDAGVFGGDEPDADADADVCRPRRLGPAVGAALLDDDDNDDDSDRDLWARPQPLAPRRRAAPRRDNAGDDGRRDEDARSCEDLDDYFGDGGLVEGDSESDGSAAAGSSEDEAELSAEEAERSDGELDRRDRTHARARDSSPSPRGRDLGTDPTPPLPSRWPPRPQVLSLSAASPVMQPSGPSSPAVRGFAQPRASPHGSPLSQPLRKRTRRIVFAEDESDDDGD